MYDAPAVCYLYKIPEVGSTITHTRTRVVLFFFFFKGPAPPRALPSSPPPPLPIHQAGQAGPHPPCRSAAEDRRHPRAPSRPGHRLLRQGEIRPGRAVARRSRDVMLQTTRQERSEEHTSELQSPCNLVCRLLLEKKN